MRSDELESVYRQYGREVYLYAYSLCHNSADAGELVSDTFFKAMMALNHNVGHIRYWLLRVCRNLYIDQRRVRARMSREPLPETRQAPHEDALALILRGERLRALYDGLMSLPDAQRELLTLHYFSECGIAEIAAITGKTPGAAKTALSRARATLKTLLEANGHGIF